MKTTQIFLLLFIGISINLQVVGQEPDNTFKPSGKPIIQVFGNFDYNATENAQKKYGFWFGRAHLGYEYQFSQQLSGKIIIDMGRPTTVGQIEVTDANGKQLNVTNTSTAGSYYTMTLKFASLQWKPSEHFNIQAGGILQNHYMTQERFWGYRYVAPTFQDKYFGIPSSDLGLIAYYKASEKFGFDVALTNGEGFRFDQDAYGDVKIASGIDFNPVKGLQTRFFYDNTKSKNPLKPAVQQLFSFFTGYKYADKFRIGGEYNYRMNHLNINDHDLFGWSFYGSYSVWKNTELFARFDLLQANTLNGAANNWDYQNTGKAYIAGIHYNLEKGVSVSLNYQGWQPEDDNLNFQHHIVMSFEYKI
jgi:hypothetical protein